MKYYFILFAILFSYACKREQNVEGLSRSILIDKKQEIKTIRSDSIFDSVKYIKLETTSESIIHTIDKIIIDKYIYILDTKQNSVLLFDLDGKYLKKVNFQGSGPEEFISLDDFLIHQEDIYVLSTASKAIVIYDKEELSFKDRFPLDDFYSKLVLSGNTIYLYSDFQSHNYKNISLYDMAKREIKGRYKDYPKTQVGIGYSKRNHFFLNMDTLYAVFPYEYSIFRLTPKDYEKILNFDFGEKYMFSHKLMLSSSDDRRDYLLKADILDHPVYDIENIVITNSHYIVSFNRFASHYTLFQNRYSSDYFYGYLCQTEDYPLASPELLYYQEGMAIQSVDASTVILSMTGDISKNIPIEISNNIQFDDNPILALYGIKLQYR